MLRRRARARAGAAAEPVYDRPAVGRGRAAGAAAAATVGAGIVALARVVMVIATLIVALIVLAIVLRDVDANPANSVVKGIHDAANFFASPFNDLFKETGHYKRAITINWGVAAVLYLAAGILVSRAIARIGRAGPVYRRRTAAV